MSNKAEAYLAELDTAQREILEIIQAKQREMALIAARAEGFRAALELLGPPGNDNETPSHTSVAKQRRPRRQIPELIIRELSFSGQTMSTNQIARAIDYLPDKTEAALQSLKAKGRVLRGERGWAISLTAKSSKETNDESEQKSP